MLTFDEFFALACKFKKFGNHFKEANTNYILPHDWKDMIKCPVGSANIIYKEYDILSYPQIFNFIKDNEYSYVDFSPLAAQAYYSDYVMSEAAQGVNFAIPTTVYKISKELYNEKFGKTNNSRDEGELVEDKKHSCTMIYCHKCGWITPLADFQKTYNKKCPDCNSNVWRRAVVKGVDIYMSC
jgi:DNA-directed RNA polymerase subunit RPC12/RpoP